MAGVTTSDQALDLILDNEQVRQHVRSANILVVGSGGIGCEVIKTFLLCGFRSFTLVDLDTIDVSNLNRQFLFTFSDVGKSKCVTAATVGIERYAHPDTKHGAVVTPISTPIQDPQFNRDFFSKFTFVVNGLDNMAARVHVNRMCLSANVLLLESGTAGYHGTTFAIQKGVFTCYECEGPRKEGKTFPSCTIRNTPSAPIHCIVWAKHLFNQLFGEVDGEDFDVSPDLNDPTLKDSEASPPPSMAGDELPKEVPQEKNDEPIKLKLRETMKKSDYDAGLLFTKLFKDDIEYLWKMDKLWENRAKPSSIELDNVIGKKLDIVDEGSNFCLIKDQRIWLLSEAYERFVDALMVIKGRISVESPFQSWDKDDEAALDFVVAASLFRSHCFSIEKKSKWDVKSMAGNIIPAIASTNAVIGGMLASMAIRYLTLKVKAQDSEDPLSTLNQLMQKNMIASMLRGYKINGDAFIISSSDISPPNPDCYICNSKVREVELSFDLEKVLFKDFVSTILNNELNFSAPTISDSMNEGCSLLWSSDDLEDYEPEEMDEYNTRLMSSFAALKDSAVINITDSMQNQEINVTLRHMVINPNENDGLWYKVLVTNQGSVKKEETVIDEPKPSTSSAVEQVDIDEDIEAVGATASKYDEEEDIVDDSRLKDEKDILPKIPHPFFETELDTMDILTILTECINENDSMVAEPASTIDCDSDVEIISSHNGSLVEEITLESDDEGDNDEEIKITQVISHQVISQKRLNPDYNPEESPVVKKNRPIVHNGNDGDQHQQEEEDEIQL